MQNETERRQKAQNFSCICEFGMRAVALYGIPCELHNVYVEGIKPFFEKAPVFLLF